MPIKWANDLSVLKFVIAIVDELVKYVEIQERRIKAQDPVDIKNKLLPYKIKSSYSELGTPGIYMRNFI